MQKGIKAYPLLRAISSHPRINRFCIFRFLPTKRPLQVFRKDFQESGKRWNMRIILQLIYICTLVLFFTSCDSEPSIFEEPQDGRSGISDRRLLTSVETAFSSLPISEKSQLMENLRLQIEGIDSRFKEAPRFFTHQLLDESDLVSMLTVPTGCKRITVDSEQSVQPHATFTRATAKYRCGEAYVLVSLTDASKSPIMLLPIFSALSEHESFAWNAKLRIASQSEFNEEMGRGLILAVIDNRFSFDLQYESHEKANFLGDPLLWLRLQQE